MRALSTIATVALALIASALAAEEPAAAPYLFVIESEVQPADAGRWSAAVSATTLAHAEHPEGNTWTAYRRLTGGPNEAVFFFFPVGSLAEMDGWKSSRSLVIEHFGAAPGRRILADLELDLNDTDRLMALLPELSHPPETGAAPRYLWLARVTVPEGKATEFAALFKRVIRAHAGHPDGRAWLAYSNVIGGSGSEVLMMYGFDRFAELDEWPSRREVLSELLGDEEAGRLSAALSAVSCTTTGVWHLEPALSQQQ
jgi:hypothetical protein